MKHTAVFFDRDGVLSALVAYPDNPATAARRPEDFRLLPNVRNAVELLPLGMLKFVVTNQPGISTGVLRQSDMEWMHVQLQKKLGLDEIIVGTNPSDPNYYKPGAHHVIDIINRYNIDPTKSFLVGDRWKDVLCGQRAGLRTILVTHGAPGFDDGGSGVIPDYYADTVYEACQIIVQEHDWVIAHPNLPSEKCEDK